MKIKTSEATPIQINWLVAKCEGEDYCAHDGVDGIGNAFEATHYSTNWAQGGPIIEREGITTAPYSTHNGVVREWKAGRDWPMSHFPYYLGPTPLIAAMRCYVASKLGDEVEIPGELT
jgi:hypothetical protein